MRRGDKAGCAWGVNAREQHKRFLILTDGQLTESGYFEAVRRLAVDEINIVARGSKDIDVLVNMAIERKQKSDYDVVAIVCDIDERLKSEKSKTTLMDAIRRAKKEGILVCLSHESFEIWLLAHDGMVEGRAGSRSEAKQMALEKGLVKGRNGKEIVPSKITKASIMRAMAEARRLRSAHGGDILKDSPTTDVDRLVGQFSWR